MIVEFTLSSIESTPSKVGSFLDRQRFEVSDSNALSGAAVEFLGRNSQVLDSMISNKEFLANLLQVKSLNLFELDEVKYVLAQNNLGLFYWIVKQDADNSNGIPEKSIEYNVLYTPIGDSLGLKACHKILQPSEQISYSELYENIKTSLGLFSEDSNLFVGEANPYEYYLKSIREAEQVLGVAPSTLITYIQGILSALNIDTIIVTE